MVLDPPIARRRGAQGKGRAPSQVCGSPTADAQHCDHPCVGGTLLNGSGSGNGSGCGCGCGAPGRPVGGAGL